MKKIIFCISICLLNLPASAIDYNDFPPDLQQVLDEKIDELDPNEGIFIAGRIKMSDGAHIKSGEDVMVNLYGPLWVYEDGWFMMDRTFTGRYPGARSKLVLRAFGYEPNDVFVKILKGEVTYVECVMQKVPDENLASIAGIVVDDDNNPYEGASVHLSFPFANHGYRGSFTSPYRAMTTGQDGQYFFDGLSSTQHSLAATASGCAYHSVLVTPSAGKTITQDLKLYPNYKVVLDYVYQADGNCIFDGGDLRMGTIEWVNGNDGLDFSDGKVEGYEPNSLRDIEMRQEQGLLKFQNFYVNGQNGFYDEGDVAFESVTEAARTGYSTSAKPVIVGHTYVVRTYENKYAKFVVRSISGGE